ARIRNAPRQGLDLLGAADEAEPVAEPLHDGSAHEDRSLQAVGDLAGDLPSHGREQAVPRGDGPPARVHEEKAAGAVRVLGRAGRETRLAERRGLLVAGNARDRYRRAEDLLGRRAVGLGRAADFREDGARNAEDPEELVVPLERVDVEEEGPAGVGRIGRVDAPAAQPPQHKGIPGAEGRPARLRAASQPGLRLEQVRDLRPGEVGIEDEAGFRAESLLVTVALQTLADRSRHAALPHDRVGDGFARSAIPEDRGLALVRDAEGGHVLRGRSGALERLPRRREPRGPDRLRVVLDLSGSGEDLRELPLGRCDGQPVASEDDRAAGRRAGIESEEVPAHETRWYRGTDARRGYRPCSDR